MTEATYRGVNWGTEQETTGLACLQNFDPANYASATTKPKWIGDTNTVLFCGIVKALLDAHRLVWLTQLRYDLRKGNITDEAAPSISELLSGTPNPVGSSETRDKVREFTADDELAADVPKLYDVVCFEVLQAIRSSRPIQEPSSGPGASLVGVTAQLGALPAVAIVLLGVAAVAGVSYLGAEATESVAKAWSAVEVEKAWAVNRAWAEVEVAKQTIAAGQPYKMSDWAKMRAAVATASQTSWAPLALGGALAVVIGASAYFLRTKPHAVAHHANPAARRLVPRRPRRNPPALPPAKKRSKKNPKRKKNPRRNPPLPPKKKSARKDARKKTARPSGKFLRSQRAKGRTEAQARAAWELSHKKKSHKGRRGKR